MVSGSSGGDAPGPTHAGACRKDRRCSQAGEGAGKSLREVRAATLPAAQGGLHDETADQRHVPQRGIGGGICAPAIENGGGGRESLPMADDAGVLPEERLEGR